MSYQADSEQVAILRSQTGEGLASCKRALIRAEGDMDLAIGYLRYQNAAIAAPDKEAWIEAQARAYAAGRQDRPRPGRSASGQNAASVTASDVRRLRELTGLGLIRCKQALEKTDGDIFLAAGYMACSSPGRSEDQILENAREYARKLRNEVAHREGPGL